MKLAEEHLKELNKREREIIPASELIVGMQCGGSDAFSGITSNPVAGFACGSDCSCRWKRYVF
ncbi:MAG: UxaA family hydrolase [Bacillus subtilis]|nr:UxaA family hydrolase [Bacillus subtilis]